MEANNYDGFAIARAKGFANQHDLNHAYIEKPAMYSLLPNVSGKKVLCVGCGTGEECAELLRRGAKAYGIDTSIVSINYAREHVPGAVFEVIDMDQGLANLSDESPFDLIYSSLALHYSTDISQLFIEFHRLLSPAGQLLFSVGHPLKWAAQAYRAQGDNHRKSFIMGYERDGQEVKIFGNYLEEQKMTQTFADGMAMSYWMRTPSRYFKLLTTTGFEVLEFLEPSVLPAVQAIDSVFEKIHSKLPQFMIFLAQRR